MHLVQRVNELRLADPSKEQRKQALQLDLNLTPRSQLVMSERHLVQAHPLICEGPRPSLGSVCSERSVSTSCQKMPETYCRK